MNLNQLEPGLVQPQDHFSLRGKAHQGKCASPGFPCMRSVYMGDILMGMVSPSVENLQLNTRLYTDVQ